MHAARTVAPAAVRDLRPKLLPRVDIPVARAASWSSQPVLAIQNANATKALMIPLGSLSTGRHRLHFELTRRWIRSDDAPTPETAYLRDATIDLELV